MKKRITKTTPIPNLGVLMLDVKQVASLCNLGVSTIWKLAKNESSGFPKPVYFGTRTARWKAREVKGWVSRLGAS